MQYLCPDCRTLIKEPNIIAPLAGIALCPHCEGVHKFEKTSAVNFIVKKITPYGRGSEPIDLGVQDTSYSLDSFKLNDLKADLQRAEGIEDYELCAQLRDKINLLECSESK